MLGTLSPNKKSSWRDMVLTLVHAYKCTRNASMGFILFDVWLEPQLPVNLHLGTQKAEADTNATTHTKCVQQWCERLKWACHRKGKQEI